MSDDEEEYEYDYGSDAEYDYGSDQDNEEDGDNANMNDKLIEIENLFYEGDDIRNENPVKAIEMFEKVIEMENNLGDRVKWRFKALQYLVVMYFKTNEYNKMVERYRLMLQYISSVTRNEITDAINVILDTIAAATQVSVLSEMYEITLVALKTANNERLWINTNLKLGKVYLEEKKFTEVDNLITILMKALQSADGTPDSSKGTLLLEVYCLEIQLCSATGNSSRMKRVYPKTLNLNAAVTDPRIMGIIREEGGKMQMNEGNWEDAYNELYESFRNYQEAGNSRARVLLKYVVLASMLALSDINPFAAREAKVYAEDREILAMSDLRQSLEANDLSRFERTIRNKQNRIIDEPFLMIFIEPLRKRMREQVLLNLIRPYKTITIKFLASELSLSPEEIERLLVEMILDGRLQGHIDQTNNNLVLDSVITAEDRLLNAIGKWADELSLCSEAITAKLQ